MKKGIIVKAVFALIGIIVLLAGCGFNQNTGEGVIVLNISQGTFSAKTIVPDIEMEIAYYMVYGTGPGEATFEELIVPETTAEPVTVEMLATVEICWLAIGEWTITVKAFNENDEKIGEGTTEDVVMVEKNQIAYATVTVTPLTGKGQLKITLSWPSGIIGEPSVVGTLDEEAINFGEIEEGLVGEGVSTVIYESLPIDNEDALEAGYYSLIIKLKNGETVVWGAFEAVRIIAGEVTSEAYSYGLESSPSWQVLGTEGFSGGAAKYTSLFVYDGTPYVAYCDETLGKAVLKKFNGTGWVSVSEPGGDTGFSAGAASYTSLYVDNDNGTPYVAYKDATNSNKATVRKFSGTSWDDVGNPGFSADIVDYTSLFVYGGIPYVAYQDRTDPFFWGEYKANSMKFNGTSWEVVPASATEGFSDDKADYTSLYIDNGTPYVAYSDNSKGKRATVMKFNGTSWDDVVDQLLFTPISTTEVQYTSLYVENDTPYIAYKDMADFSGIKEKATVRKFNGTEWEDVGTPGFSTAEVNYTSLFIDNGTPYVAYQDMANISDVTGRATVKKFNGMSWQDVGSAGFSAGTADYTSLYVYKGTPYVAFSDGSQGGSVTVMKFE